MHFSLLLLCLAVQVLADGQAILDAMSNISANTIGLNNTINNFPTGGLSLGDVALLSIGSTNLLNAINSGTGVANQSAPLTTAEALQIAQATSALSTTTTTTLSNLVRVKSQFDSLLIVSPIVLSNLKSENDATNQFGAAVVAKVPAELQGAASTLLNPIAASFNTTIAAYSA